MDNSRWGIYVFGWGALFLSGLLALIAIALWNYLMWIALTILLVGVVVAGLEVYMRWEKHQVEMLHLRNKAVLLHESEHGFGYLHNGQVQGYTHSVGLQQPYSPPPPFGLLEPEPDMPKTFGEMVGSGHVAPGLDYVLAYNEGGEPIKMPALTSIGIGGGQGMGKTVTTLSLMMQSVIKYNGRVRFLVLDPHKYVAGDESLSAKVSALLPFFLTLQDVRSTIPPDDTEYLATVGIADKAGISSVVAGEDELEYWLGILELEMKRRLHGKEGDLWVIVADEFAALMDTDLAKRLARLLEKINQQARKVGMFALLSSVEWKATRTGGSELRHSIVSFIAHNMPKQISELVLPGDVASQTPTLDVGEVVVWNRGQSHRGRVPYASAEDAEKVVLLYYPRSRVQITEVAE